MTIATHPSDAGRRPERGAVTAELAIGLPVVVLLLVAVLTIAAASGAQLRALDAARAGARAVAIGQDAATVRAVVDHVGGAGSDLRLEHDGEWVVVEVSRPVAGGWFTRLPLRATGKATAWVEP
ncbi:hypothetical protein Xcel_0328 [Xylanimonas cellulosilytica DSM 15894]|uniref:TadE-like domain-containing protein n=1 Tax=Xylanimonas cellulosilytica (strain DSM 15894 / JCM 12276 / CECT 5975 / KCTC 9989 / LMG 20990 / NBRC 107835 / XIL07) TaxID=446471 RepID=D1BV96_XYLCX|nr:TadE family type IV pilus minor pilin [Xylanimonas cellulosilytica]ACZ29367.1 hypothetical protein Xcel_0328 [Xylanimonas cellulosilytica DSM 15894]